MATEPLVLERRVRARTRQARPRALARTWTRVAPFAPIAVASVLWALALTRTDPTGVSGHGLLAALPPEYFAALGVLTVGFALSASSDRPRAGVLGAYVVALVAVLHATTAILYPEPRYAWTYKHLGVIDYLAAHGAADRSVDIYNNWPGFFALNAWLSKTAGIEPLSYAAWAQPLFELGFVGAIVFALRGVTRDARLRWTAAWLFVVANWIGQDYLSPQAFTFLLAILILGLVIRCAPWARPPRTRPMWAAVKAANRIGNRALRGRALIRQEAEPAPLPPRAALAVGGLAYVAVVLSHQLSPVMLLASVALLVAATRRPPVWILVVMAAVELWWVSLGYDFVGRHFNLFDFDPSVTARTGLGTGLPGVELGAHLSRAGMGVMALIALAGLARRIRAGRLDAAPAALAVAPVLVTLFQSYGGEGPLRVYLFALPWLAFFAAAACRPSARARTALGRSWRLIAVTAIVGTGTLFGYFGQEPTNYMTSDDVAVSRWYLDHAPAGASLTLLAPNFPDRINRHYDGHVDEVRTLFGTPDVRRGVLVPEALPVCRGGCGLLLGHGLRTFLLAERAPAHYVVVSPSQLRYARYYGLADQAAFDRFTRALLSSPAFVLDFRQGGAYVFRYVGTS